MLTEEQIERLHRFCVEHYVRHYDVQVELVDHLGTAIEEKMSDNHLLSFEQALQQVYRGFGSGALRALYKPVKKHCNVPTAAFACNLSTPFSVGHGSYLRFL